MQRSAKTMECGLDRAWFRHVAGLNEAELYRELKTSREGIAPREAQRRIDETGPNVVAAMEREPMLVRLVKSFLDPFVGILVLVAVVSLLTDVIFAKPGKADIATPAIIAVMIAVSGLLRFVQESRSTDAAAALAQTIEITCNVERKGAGRHELPLDEVAPGDIVHLHAGDMVPADMRIVLARDLFVGQSALTGESDALEKTPVPQTDDSIPLADIGCLAFMGTTVISGTGVGVVIATGPFTMIGSAALGGRKTTRKTSYDTGISEVSRLLVRLMVLMVPTVLLVNGLTKGDWLQSLLFALSIAVGLTPEMLPMIVTTCLAKGAVDLSHQKVVVKRLDAIQDLGAMDVLCTDKTGTLTEDSVALERYLDVHGTEDVRVLEYAFLNSFFETGLRNLIDSAIISRAQKETLRTESPIDADALTERNFLVDELPFDFERRRVSVVVGNRQGQTRMITKGAVEEVVELCSHAEYHGKVLPLSDALMQKIAQNSQRLASQGMRVLGVAIKDEPGNVGVLTDEDERDMTLVGYLAFLDPPKESAGAAVRELFARGVETKVLTGDSARVARYVCGSIGIAVKGALTGPEVEALDDKELGRRVEGVTLFSKLSPDQKARVVAALRARGHVVGFMGDGVNDAAAMRASDCELSVDTAVDIAKESADIILLKKDLGVLGRGIVGGRRTFANMEKYVRITAASNFGNIFSVLAASVFLPFLPMTAVQLLLLNLMNDVVCAAVPWDSVDDELLARPRTWDTGAISGYMRWMGPVSSMFDVVSYLVLFFVVCPAAVGAPWAAVDGTSLEATFVGVFQAGWFLESMLTQILAILVLRAEGRGLAKSAPAAPLVGLSVLGAALALVFAMTPVGVVVDFATPPVTWLAWVAGIALAYCGALLLAKRAYAARRKR